MVVSLGSADARGEEENTWLLSLIFTVPSAAQVIRHRRHFALPVDNPCKLRRLDPLSALPPDCLFRITCSSSAITYLARSAREVSGPSIRQQIHYLVTGSLPGTRRVSGVSIHTR